MGGARSSRWTPDFDFFYICFANDTIFRSQSSRPKQTGYMENNLTELIFCRHSICRGVDRNYKEIYEKKM